jgi:hypothetical protein
LYQNRALCFQKLSRWADVLADSEQALNLLDKSGSSSVKALYLQGTANLNLRRQLILALNFAVLKYFKSFFKAVSGALRLIGAD